MQQPWLYGQSALMLNYVTDSIQSCTREARWLDIPVRFLHLVLL